MLSKMTFAEIKSEYNNRREEERKKIIDFLARQKDEEGRPLFYKADGKSYDNRPYAGGQGLSRYGSGRFKTAYDLRNWKWVQRAATVFMCLFRYRLLTLTREIRKICMYCMTGWVSVSEPAVTKKPLSTGERFRQCF